MVNRLGVKGFCALALSLALVGLFPSVNNPTPAKAIDLGANSIDDPASLWIMVNKTRPLNPIKYQPADLVVPGFGPLNGNPYKHSMRKDAADAAEKMATAMKSVGKGRLVIQSGYRSYAVQKTVHDRQVAKHGKTEGELWAARPGYSEHQTGLAIDVSARNQGCQIRVCFGGTKSGIWLAQNAYRFGFIVRYPKGSQAITGYEYEPWHLRYVGVELATDMKKKGIKTLEEYFNLPAAPNYP